MSRSSGKRTATAAAATPVTPDAAPASPPKSPQFGKLVHSKSRCEALGCDVATGIPFNLKAAYASLEKWNLCTLPTPTSFFELMRSLVVSGLLVKMDMTIDRRVHAMARVQERIHSLGYGTLGQAVFLRVAHGLFYPDRIDAFCNAIPASERGIVRTRRAERLYWSLNEEAQRPNTSKAARRRRRALAAQAIESHEHEAENAA